jgi:hypothetical protein
MKRRLSPTFVCKFSDGQVTVMTVYGTPQKPDLARGIKLARFAYESRCKKQPPAITSAHFESNGTTLVEYDAAELAGACMGEQKRRARHEDHHG